jgi:hypothetical protein
MPAIVSSSTSAEWTAVGDEAMVTGVTTNSRGRSGVIGSTGTDKGVCITGTGWGACTRTLGRLCDSCHCLCWKIFGSVSIRSLRSHQLYVILICKFDV